MPTVINFYTNMPLFLYDPIFETNLLVYKTYLKKRKRRKKKDRRKQTQARELFKLVCKLNIPISPLALQCRLFKSHAPYFL